MKLNTPEFSLESCIFNAFNIERIQQPSKEQLTAVHIS